MHDTSRRHATLLARIAKEHGNLTWVASDGAHVLEPGTGPNGERGTDHHVVTTTAELRRVLGY